MDSFFSIFTQRKTCFCLAETVVDPIFLSPTDRRLPLVLIAESCARYSLLGRRDIALSSFSVFNFRFHLFLSQPLFLLESCCHLSPSECCDRLIADANALGRRRLKRMGRRIDGPVVEEKR